MEDPVAWQTNVLVVANRTAGSDELIDALKRRAERGPVRCTLLMPAGPSGRDQVRARLDEFLERMRLAGIEADGTIGFDSNPLFCIGEVWDPGRYDEIVISTFPTGLSHWLKVDLPQRVAKLTDAPVEHVVSQSTSAREPATHPAPRRHAVSSDAAAFIGRFFGSHQRDPEHARRP
jgi:hypothetical protein